MNKPTPLQQAIDLQGRTHRALHAFREGAYTLKEYDESEVKFRHDAIEGILIMALNDIDALARSIER